MKKQRANWTYLPAYLALKGLFGFFRLLPMDVASALGGRLARGISRFLRWNRVAEKNLKLIFPEWSEAQHQQTLREMWDNLGRNLAEYAWITTSKFQQRITLSQQAAELLNETKNSDRPIVFAGGHFANWEVIPLTMYLYGRPATLIYRRANNPYVERLIHRIRLQYCAGHFPKGKKGATEAIRTLKAGGVLGMLIDQKMNDGVPVPFLGRTAMTAPAFADLALRNQARLVAIGVRRIKGVSFEIDVEEIVLQETSGIAATEAVILQTHHIFEQWIRKTPAQWLWVHQRWGKW